MLKPVSRREFVKKLRRLGFEGPFSGGKHQFMKKGSFKICVPNPHGKEIGAVLLKQIIKDLRISDEEFLNL